MQSEVNFDFLKSSQKLSYRLRQLIMQIRIEESKQKHFKEW